MPASWGRALAKRRIRYDQGMSRRRPKLTNKSKASGKTLKATPGAAEAVQQRRKPRKQDYVAAVIALSVIVAMVLSALLPFFLR